jgi:hypothetical protein
MPGNYPNMSYCMCQNTRLALQQVASNLDSFDDEDDDFISDMSEDEFEALQTIFALSEDLLKLKEYKSDKLNARSLND